MGTGPVKGIDVMKGKDKEAVQRPWRESVQDRLTALHQWIWCHNDNVDDCRWDPKAALSGLGQC